MVGFDSDEERIPPPFAVETAECRWDWPPLYQVMRGDDNAAADAAYQRLAHADEEPWFVSCMASARMEQACRRVARRGFDLALIEHTNMAHFLALFPHSSPKSSTCTTCIP